MIQIRKFFTALFLFCFLTIQVFPQMNGVYRLTGVPEMASGFNFKPDSTFEFFYSYGAVDRFANGTYSVKDDTLLLYSDKKPGDDFEIIEQSIKGKTYKVVVRDENAFLTQKVIAITYFGELKKIYEANEEGIIDINTKNCEKIFLQHELFPDEATLIKDELNANTYFEVKLKPTLQEVSFTGAVIRLKDDSITCNMPELFPANARFVREK